MNKNVGINNSTEKKTFNSAYEVSTYYTNYYTANDVEFDIFNNSLSGKHINELGEGMLYEITFRDAIGSSAKLESEAEFEDFYLNPVRSYSEL